MATQGNTTEPQTTAKNSPQCLTFKGYAAKKATERSTFFRCVKWGGGGAGLRDSHVRVLAVLIVLLARVYLLRNVLSCMI